MSQLNVPISINGGTTLPAAGKLDERELFLNTQTKYLYACFAKNSTPQPVKVVDADNASNMKCNWFTITANNTNPTFTVGNMKFDGDTFGPTGTSATSTFSLTQPTFFNVQKMQLSSNSGQIYGYSLPSTGMDGQIFFLIK